MCGARGICQTEGSRPKRHASRKCEAVLSYHQTQPSAALYGLLLFRAMLQIPGLGARGVVAISRPTKTALALASERLAPGRLEPPHHMLKLLALAHARASSCS